MFAGKAPSEPELKYTCHTVKKLMMQRIFLTEKKEGETNRSARAESNLLWSHTSITANIFVKVTWLNLSYLLATFDELECVRKLARTTLTQMFCCLGRDCC